MDSMDAKRELLENHFRHNLKELIRHLVSSGDIEALIDLRHLTECAVDGALDRIRPARRMEQEVVSDPESGQEIG
jgi:hypothetical protein